MELNLKHKAKAVIDYLYHQLFNEPAYNPSSASHTTACVNSYAPTKSDPWDAQGQYSNDEIGEWAATAHDKVVAVASSASNAVSNAAANLIDSTQTDGNEHGEGSSFPSFWGESQSKDQYHLLERAQSSLGPSTAWSDFAGSHAPRLHELQSQWGLHGLADRFGVEPYIVLLVLLLPIVVLLLSVCAMMGAGHPNEEPHHDYRHENMAEPSKVRGKEDRKSSSSSKQADGTSPRSYAGAVKQGIDRKGPMADGAKAESHGNQEQEQLGNGGRRSSWAAMIGSAGLVPTESPEHHDLVSETHGKDNIADGNPADAQTSRSKTNETANSHNSSLENAAKSFSTGAHSITPHGDTLSMIMEDIVGPSDIQVEGEEIDFDNFMEYETDDSKSETLGLASKESGIQPTGTNKDCPSSHDTLSTQDEITPASNNRSKTRVPRTYSSIKETVRHRHQPHILNHHHSRYDRHQPRDDNYEQTAEVQSLASKIIDFANTNSIAKNLNGISGGVLGATLATVAAATNIAETAAYAFKEKLPSLNDVTTKDALAENFISKAANDLKELAASTDVGQTSSTSAKPEVSSMAQLLFPSDRLCVGTKGKGVDRSSVHTQENRDENMSIEPGMAANASRTRQRSVNHSEPTMTTAASSTSSTTTMEPTTAATAFIASVKAAAEVLTAEDISIYRGTSISTVDGNTERSSIYKRVKVYDVEDITLGPKLIQTPYHDPIRREHIKRDKGYAEYEKSEKGEKGEEIGEKTEANFNHDATPAPVKWSERKKQHDVEDISLGPKRVHVYHDPIKNNGHDKHGKEVKVSHSDTNDLAEPDSTRGKSDNQSPTPNSLKTSPTEMEKENPIRGTDWGNAAVMAVSVEQSKPLSGSHSLPLSLGFTRGPRVEEAVSKIETAVQESSQESVPETTNAARQRGKRAASDVKTASKSMIDSVNSSAHADGAAVKDQAKETVSAAAHSAQAKIENVKSSVKKKVQGAKTAVDKVTPQTIDDTVASAHNTKGLAAHVIEDTIDGARNTVIPKVKDAKDASLHKAADLSQDASDKSKTTANLIIDSAHSAKAAAVGEATTAGNTVTETAQCTKDTALHTASDVAQKAVERAKGTAISTVGTVLHATDMVANEMQAAIDTSLDRVHAVKDVAVEQVASVVGTAQSVEDTGADQAKATIDSALNTAQSAKNTVAKRSADAAYTGTDYAKATVGSVKNTVGSAKDTVLQTAGAVISGTADQSRSTVDSAKDAITHTVAEPARQAEQMIGTMVDAGKGTVDSGIKGVKEVAEKLGQEILEKAEEVTNATSSSAKKKKKKKKKAKAKAKKTNEKGTESGTDVLENKVKEFKSKLDSAIAGAQKRDKATAKNPKKGTRKKIENDASQEHSTLDANAESSTTETAFETSRDTLSSVKHLAGGVGDAASEVMVHAAEIASQSLTKVKGSTAALLEATKNDVLGKNIEHHHDRNGRHEELRDIENDLEDKLHFHGISASTSSAAKKANEVAKEYYDSLPGGNSSSALTSTATDTSFITAKDQDASSISSKSSRDSIVLDHDDYVFRDKNGDQVAAEDMDEVSNSDEESDNNGDRKENEQRAFFKAPGILRSAKVAASAMVARVADVSYENLDIARSSLSGLAGNVAGTFLGHREHQIQEQKDAHESKDAKADSEDVAATGTDLSSNNKTYEEASETESADDDSFIDIASAEDFHLDQHHDDSTSKDIPRDKNNDGKIDPSPQLSASPMTSTHTKPEHHHAAVLPISEVSHNQPKTSTTEHTTSAPMSYSRVTKLNLAKDDYGVRAGMSESHEGESLQEPVAQPTQDPTPPEDSHLLNQDSIPHHGQSASILLKSAHKHNHHHTASEDRDEHEVKEQVSKVPVADARQDSGFNIIL